jgi:hypothetical protein
MKRIVGTTMAMALSFMLAFAALGIGLYQLEVARAEEALATFDLALAGNIYARLEKMAETGSRIPWIFDAARADLRVRRSRVSYWRKDYPAILEETAAAEAKGKSLDPPLRFIRANARYRAIIGEQRRGKVIQGLEESIRDYAGILESDPTMTDAAFDYELLLILRDDIASGRRPALLSRQDAQKHPPDQMKGVLGEQGIEPKEKAQQKMKVIVPKEGDEDPNKRGQEPSKGSATKKRG